MVIGSAKCGTTSLYYYMEQHPEICVPPCKETYVFNRRSMAGTWPEIQIMSDVEYEALYRKNTTSRTKAWGEISTSYLYYHDEAVPEIKNRLGDIKILHLLRNPIDRAYSNWTFTFASHGETLSFEQAIKEEENRKQQKLMFMGHYVSLGFYHQGVKAFRDNFSQHRVYLLEDLKERAPETMRDIFEFIGVDGGVTPDYTTTYNPSGIPRIRLLQRLIFQERNTEGAPVQNVMRALMGRSRADKLFHKMRQYNLKRVPMEKETRQRLVEVYRDDILQLQDLIKRDLSHWLAV